MESRAGIAAIVCDVLRQDPEILKRLADGNDAETERLLRDGLPKLIRLVSLAYKEGTGAVLDARHARQEVPPDDAPPDNEDDAAVHAHLLEDGTNEDRPDDYIDELPPPRRPGRRSR